MVLVELGTTKVDAIKTNDTCTCLLTLREYEFSYIRSPLVPLGNNLSHAMTNRDGCVIVDDNDDDDDVKYDDNDDCYCYWSNVPRAPLDSTIVYTQHIKEFNYQDFPVNIGKIVSKMT